MTVGDDHGLGDESESGNPDAAATGSESAPGAAADDAWPEVDGPEVGAAAAPVEGAPIDPDAAPPAAEAMDPLDVEGLVLSLETVTGERDQWQDSAQRIQAEFENYKKQSQKRLDIDVERISGRIIEAMLPVLDACDASVAHGAQEVAPIHSALLDALTGQGLERLFPENDAFDPEAHEAVMHEAAADDGPGYPVVAEVMRAGYRWQGRVLRPAMVRVQG